MWYIINYSTLKKILVIIITSILTFVLCTLLRALPQTEVHFNAIYISAPIGFILYYILALCLFKKYSENIRPYIILMVIISAVVIIQLPPRLFDFKGSAITLPEQFIHLLGVISGYLSYQKYIKKWVAMIIGGVCYIILFPILFPLYFDYLYYDSITGKVENASTLDFKIINKEKDTLTLQELRGDYTILDLWHTRCPSCIKSFPKVQALYRKVQPRNDLSLYALNYPLDDTDPFLFMQERGFDIPVLQLLNEEKDKMEKQLEINVYPTTVILNQKRQVVFKGSEEMAEKYLDELLR